MLISDLLSVYERMCCNFCAVDFRIAQQCLLEPNAGIFFYIQEAAEYFTGTRYPCSIKLGLYYTSLFLCKPFVRYLVQCHYNGLCPRTSKCFGKSSCIWMSHNMGTRNIQYFECKKKKNGTQKLMMLVGTPPLFKIIVPESFDKPRRRNHGNKQKTCECCFDTGHADISAQSLASFGQHCVVLLCFNLYQMAS